MWVGKVVGFVEAPARGLDLPLDVRGTAFQRRVWQALREIPAGSTASYTEIAAFIGSPERKPLLTSQDEHRVDVRRPQGRTQGREQGSGCQDEGRRAHGLRIRSLHLIEQALKRPRDRDGSREPDGHPARRHRCGLEQHAPENSPRTRADRKAYTELGKARVHR
jgi:alkylated DNA nucleotide flippase Atl1